MGHFRAGIVCGNSSTMAERPSAPYNGGRMAAQMRRESPAKVAEIPPQGRKKHRQMTAQTASNGRPKQMAMAAPLKLGASKRGEALIFSRA
jgi:hypothetical protein